MKVISDTEICWVNPITCFVAFQYLFCGVSLPDFVLSSTFLLSCDNSVNFWYDFYNGEKVYFISLGRCLYFHKYK